MMINTILSFAFAMMASTANAEPLNDFPPETVVVAPAVAATPTATANNCWIAGFCHAHGKVMLGGGLDKKACAKQYADQWRTGYQLPQMVGLYEQHIFSMSVEVLCDWKP